MDKDIDFFPFTNDQISWIKEILIEKFEVENVSAFIKELCFISEGAMVLLDQQDFKTYKNDRKSMMSLLEKCSDLLEEIRKDRGICHLSTFSVLTDDDLSEERMECQELAITTGNLLTMLIRKLKQLDDTQEQRLKGRPKADSKGFANEIAKTWEKHFGKKPTSYRYGPFTDVIQIVLEALNLPCEDPQRSINAALKK